MKVRSMMKHRYVILKKSFIILGLIWISITTNLCAETINHFLCGWEPWEPYIFENDSKQLTGLDVELVQAIVKQMKFTIEFKQLPWKRHLHMVENGKIHIATSASKSSEREQYAFFSNPYRTETAVMFVRKGESKSFPLTSLDQITTSNFNIGVANEYYYGETYQELMKNPKFASHVQSVQNDALNLKKLLKNRIDGFLADAVAGVSMIRKEGASALVEKHPMIIYSDNIHVMFSKKLLSQEVVTLFNQSLTAIKQNGVYDQIMNKYLKLD